MSEPNPSEQGNYLVPTANRPYLTLDGVTGVGVKAMHALSEPPIWSAVLRIEAGSELPRRHNSALVECLVVEGSGRYATGQDFFTGDYLREDTGKYAAIVAVTDTVLFVTNHGHTELRTPTGLIELDRETLITLGATTS